MANRLADDGAECDKQAVAVFLKEAEFIRNEILTLGTSGRTFLFQSLIVIGGLLTATGVLLSLWDGHPHIIEQIKSNKWALFGIAVLGVITCLTFFEGLRWLTCRDNQCCDIIGTFWQSV